MNIWRDENKMIPTHQYGIAVGSPYECLAMECRQQLQPFEPRPKGVVNNADRLASEIGCASLLQLLLKDIKSHVQVVNSIATIGRFGGRLVPVRMHGTKALHQQLRLRFSQWITGIQRILWVFLVQILGNDQRFYQKRCVRLVEQLQSWHTVGSIDFRVPFWLLVQIDIGGVIRHIFCVQQQVDAMGERTKAHTEQP